MRFRIGDKTYAAATLTKPSIRDYLRLAEQTEALGRRFTAADVFTLEQEIAACKTPAERAAHPDLLMFLAFTVWATLLVAGEPDPFDKALDLSLDDLDFISEPEDRKAADPTKARAGSARAAKRRAGSSTGKTSKRPLTAAS